MTMPDGPTCHYCDEAAELQCPTCGRLYCPDHGDDVCVRCMAPESAIPSAALYRGSLLTLVVVSVIAVYLFISPPSDDSAASEPRAITTQPPAATQAPTRNPAAQPTAASRTTPSPQGSATAGASPTRSTGSRTHTVVSGDTLLGIAGLYDVTVEEIEAANPGVTLDPLGVGDVLVIPGE
ncbi:MAG TPA: LysM peptidoglycan-binding domain-containing protein [Tepidiformaceae bacterium]|nr:LysM peptidoglycan-binding domain-containing protein [Tepidiformaceae bacterium]